MFTRTPGPSAGVYPTLSGEVDGRKVHWVVNSLEDTKTADEREKNWPGRSRLLHLLVLNAYTVEGLTRDEYLEAVKLIQELPENEEICGLCPDPKGVKHHTITDTGLCRGHARTALEYRM